MPKTAPRSAALGHQGPQTEQPSIASPDAALQRDKPRTRSESGVRHAQERRFWGEQRGCVRVLRRPVIRPDVQLLRLAIVAEGGD